MSNHFVGVLWHFQIKRDIKLLHIYIINIYIYIYIYIICKFAIYICIKYRNTCKLYNVYM